MTERVAIRAITRATIVAEFLSHVRRGESNHGLSVLIMPSRKDLLRMVSKPKVWVLPIVQWCFGNPMGQPVDPAFGIPLDAPKPIAENPTVLADWLQARGHWMGGPLAVANTRVRGMPIQWHRDAAAEAFISAVPVPTDAIEIAVSEWPDDSSGEAMRLLVHSTEHRENLRGAVAGLRYAEPRQLARAVATAMPSTCGGVCQFTLEPTGDGWQVNLCPVLTAVGLAQPIDLG